MILQVPAGSPWWVLAAADALLFLHIAGGAVGLISGAAALTARKGGRAHRLAGLVFVVSMTIMASIGAAVSPFLPIPQRANVMAGSSRSTSLSVMVGSATQERRAGAP